MSRMPSPDQAVSRALAPLRAGQRDSGEWPTFSSAAPDMRAPEPYACSVYVTTFVVHALTRLAAGHDLDDMVQRAADFLASQRDPDGLWNYEGLAGTRLYPDLDDAACVVAALLQAGRGPDYAFIDRDRPRRARVGLTLQNRRTYPARRERTTH
jgi:hypothetical protein